MTRQEKIDQYNRQQAVAAAYGGPVHEMSDFCIVGEHSDCTDDYCECQCHEMDDSGMSPGGAISGMTIEHAEATLRKRISEDDEEMLDDMETYLWGKDDPDDYFSKVETDEELITDFEIFVEAGKK